MAKYAAVMAGGQSRRFGKDKTLESVMGKSLIEYPLQTLRNFCDEVIIVAKDCEKYSFTGAVCVQDVYDEQCPMVGIYTALKHFNGDVFVIAADTPFIRQSHAEKLFEALKGHDAAVPCINGKHHPLYACYAKSVMPYFEKAINEGQYSLMKCLTQADTVFPDESIMLASSEEASAFININTETDMDDALNSAMFK